MVTNETMLDVASALAAAKLETTIKLGLDVHAMQITVCRQIGGLLPQPAQKFAWPRFLEWVEEQIKSGAKVYCCYEAGPCGYGLYRQLIKMGAVCYVVAPQRWDERGQRVKTDKRDASQLCDRLDRYVSGNTNAFTVVCVPTPEQEERRALSRQRGAVGKEKRRCIVRGHGLMLSQGTHAPEGWWKKKEWEELSKSLPLWLRHQVEFWRSQILRLDEELDALTDKVIAQKTGPRMPKGVGALTTAVLQAEILDWSRFKNRRQVSSYTGLCPSEDSSGERRRQGAITKHGNPRVRHQLIEAVWRMQMWQPTYPPLQKLRSAQGPRARKKATVAVARQLAVDLWRLHTGQCNAEKLKLVLAEA